MLRMTSAGVIMRQTAGVGLVLVPGGGALEAATTAAAAYSGDQHSALQ